MKRKEIEYRYYTIEEDNPVLILHGEKWKQHYGNDLSELHFHNHLEIGYCFSGKGLVAFGEEYYHYKDGSMTFISRNYQHTTVSDPGSTCHWAFLFLDTDRILKRAFGDKQVLMDKIRRKTEGKAWFLSPEQFPAMEQYLRGILKVWEEKKDMYRQEIEILCSGLLIEFSRLETEEQIRSIPLKEDSLTPALEYINHNFAENIRIGKLAQICHMSETHLRRSFQNILKMSPLEYLNSVRIAAACEKLVKSNMAVNLIAEQCGYPTTSTFNRNFLRIVGCAPVEWRKRQSEYELLLEENAIRREEGW